MRHEKVDRWPQSPSQDTIMGKVLQALRATTPREVLAEETDLSSSQVASALHGLRQKGLIEWPSDIDTRAAMRKSILRGKGSILPEIEQYALMGMTPREVRIAARLEQQKEFPLNKVTYTIGKARGRGGYIPRRTPEDASDAQRAIYDSDEVTEERVKRWLKIKTMLEKSGAPLPHTRMEWRNLSNILPVVELRQIKDLKADQRNLTLLYKLLSADLLGDDVLYWQRLHELYRQHNRVLPHDFAARLRLEVYFHGMQLWKKGDKRMIQMYRRLGETIDELWFRTNLESDEQFIEQNVPNEFGYAKDDIGFFRAIGGEKFRPIVEFGNEEERNGIIFDSATHSAEREGNRRRVKTS